MNLTRPLLLLGFILLYSPSATAQPHAEKWLFAGVSEVFQNASRTAATATGGTSLTGTAFTQLVVGARYNMNPRWGFMPEVSYTPISLKGADSGESYQLLTGELRAFWSLDSVDVHTGPGLLYQFMNGSGGTATLNNGSGTATFGLPSGSTSARYFYWELGFGYSFSAFRIDLDCFVTDMFSSRRAYNPNLSLTMGVL